MPAVTTVDAAAAPYPSYVSLQTALYRRGIVTQIPFMNQSTTRTPFGATWVTSM